MDRSLSCCIATTSSYNTHCSYVMKPPTQLSTRGLSRALLSRHAAVPHSYSSLLPPIAGTRQTAAAIHSSAPDPADVAPFYATGPPPEAPQPAAEHPYAKIERRRKQAELLRSAKEIRSANDVKNKGKSPLRKRFWKDVFVKEVDGAYSPCQTLHHGPHHYF